MKTTHTLGIACALLLFGAAAGLFGQATIEHSVPNTPDQAAIAHDGAGQPAPVESLATSRYPRYQVMRDDVLVLTFPLSPEFNQTVTIQPDGYVTLLGAGSLHVEGMTVPEVIDVLKTAYAKILRDPMIDVDLKDFQRPFFIASGQVEKPGQYDLRYETTVSEGVAIAGGFTPDAKTQVFLLHRVSSGVVEVKRLSLKNILQGKRSNEDVRLRPGDMIFVPATRFSTFKKYVPYSTGLYMNPTGAIF